MARGNNRGFDRNKRVAQQLHETIARMLLMELDDPRIQSVQITDVEVTPDLRYATVYYVMLDEREQSEEVQQGLEAAIGFIKREIGKRLELQYVPGLEFEYDESVERGRRMEALIDDLDTGSDEDKS
ncbi:MAG: 30S ribosome-binding factor RbfA [Myxococcota bacterium]